jgi:integrase
MTPCSTPATLADVLILLEADSALGVNRRRDLRSALRRIARMSGKTLDRLPAELSLLRPMVNEIRPAAHDISEKTFSNLRSNFMAAVRHAGIIEARPQELTPVWEALHAALPTTRLRHGLSRFLRWCALKDLVPSALDAGALDEFRHWLSANALVKDPHRFVRRVGKLWNEAAHLLPDQGLAEIGLPAQPSNRMRRLPLAAFPESFQADLEAYLAMRADPDPFDPEAPPKPARPSTVKLLRDQLRLAANALVERGRDPATIKNLCDLVEVEAFKEIQRQILAEHDGEGSYWGEGVRKSLMTIAKHWCRLSEERLKELRHISRRVPKPEPGLTPKNRQMLRQFDDDANLARLLHLPARLFREALRTTPVTFKAAQKAQIALAIELLLNCPIRAENLRALQLNRHILRPAGSRGPAFLCLEPAEVKNEQRIDFELPKDLKAMIDTYAERFLPFFGGTDGFLFVTGSGTPKSYGALAHQVCRTIRDRTGLVMTLHQFRHLDAKLFLEAHPGGYEALRQLLGHRSIETTVRSYAGVQTRRAAHLHDQILQERRAALQHLGTGKPRRRPRPT